METTLREINSVLGVIGSFVCANDGSITVHAVPDRVSEESLKLVGRVAGQTFQALDASGQRATELDLQFSQERLILKTLRGGILAILCVRNINLPLLNLTANVATKKIAADLKSVKLTHPSEPVARAPQAAPAQPAAPAPSPTPPPTPIASAPAPSSASPMAAEPVVTVPPTPPIYDELAREVDRVLQEARSFRIDLRVLDSLAIWLCTSSTRRLLVPPEKREIVFAGRALQSDAIDLLFEQLRYKTDRRTNALYGNRRLFYTRMDCDQTAQVILDTFAMYHRLDLLGHFTHERATLPETVLLLTRLQLVEMSDAGLRDICALLIQYDLGIGAEKGKLDASEITRLCAEDWGWYKTVSINLDRVNTFATASLTPPDRSLVVERIQRLKQSIASAPKSLRWQTRARLGESMRWYDTPVIVRASGRPDMAFG